MFQLKILGLHILMNSTHQNSRRFDPYYWSRFQVQNEVLRKSETIRG